jgi:hypothetical protein
MRRQPRNHSNVSQPHSRLARRSRDTPRSPAARCHRSAEGIYAYRRCSAHRCLLHRCCRGQCNWRCYAAVSGCAFGPEAQHHRHHQAAIADSSEAGRQLHDHLSVDWASAVLTLIASNVIVLSAEAAKTLPGETLGGHLFSPWDSGPIGGGDLAASARGRAAVGGGAF